MTVHGLNGQIPLQAQRYHSFCVLSDKLLFIAKGLKKYIFSNVTQEIQSVTQGDIEVYWRYYTFLLHCASGFHCLRRICGTVHHLFHGKGDENNEAQQAVFPAPAFPRKVEIFPNYEETREKTKHERDGKAQLKALQAES